MLFGELHPFVFLWSQSRWRRPGEDLCKEKNLQSSFIPHPYLLFQSKFSRKSKLLMQALAVNLLPWAFWGHYPGKHIHENPIIWNILIVFLLNSRLCTEKLRINRRKVKSSGINLGCVLPTGRTPTWQHCRLRRACFKITCRGKPCLVWPVGVEPPPHCQGNIMAVPQWLCFMGSQKDPKHHSHLLGFSLPLQVKPQLFYLTPRIIDEKELFHHRHHCRCGHHLINHSLLASLVVSVSRMQPWYIAEPGLGLNKRSKENHKPLKCHQ
jgi:hypothetical protein